METYLADIKKLGSQFFSPKEVATILEVDIADFVAKCKNPATDEYKAYHGGCLQSESLLRESILRLANQGSSPAQTMAMELMKHNKLNMKNR